MKLILAGTSLAALAIAASTAMADIDPAQFDLNKDKYLDKKEQSALRVAVDASPDASERDHFYATLLVNQDVDKPVLVKEFVRVSRRKCTNDNTRFVLRRKLTTTKVTGCTAIGDVKGGGKHNPINDGAVFSFTKDFNADTSVLSLEGAIGYVISPQNTEALLGNGSSLADWGYLAFAEADGEINESDPNEGSVKLGFKAEQSFGGARIAKTDLAINAYYLTDFDLKGEGYGLEINVTPYSAKYLINGSIKGTEGRYAYFVFKPSINMLSVKNAGTSGLTAGDSYGWAGGQFGVEAFSAGILGHGAKFEAGVHAFKDLRSGISAIQRYSTVDLYINPGRTAAVQLSYVDGKTPTNFNPEKTLKVGLAFSF